MFRLGLVPSDGEASTSSGWIVALDADLVDSSHVLGHCRFLLPLGDFEGIALSGCCLLSGRNEAHPETYHDLIACEARGLGVGGRLWRSTGVFCTYLASKAEELVACRDVLELGAGIGACGLACARLGARSVCLTDMPEVCDLLRLNTELNKGRLRAPVFVAPCVWGRPLPGAVKPSTSTLVILSDCVYNSESDALLVITLKELLIGSECSSNGGGTGAMAVLAHDIPEPEAHPFFAALGSSGLSWETVAARVSSDASEGRKVVYVVCITPATCIAASETALLQLDDSDKL